MQCTTHASSALGVLNDYALYVQIDALTHSLQLGSVYTRLVYAARVHGPWIRAVCSVYRQLSSRFHTQNVTVSVVREFHRILDTQCVLCWLVYCSCTFSMEMLQNFPYTKIEIWFVVLNFYCCDFIVCLFRYFASIMRSVWILIDVQLVIVWFGTASSTRRTGKLTSTHLTPWNNTPVILGRRPRISCHLLKPVNFVFFKYTGRSYVTEICGYYSLYDRHVVGITWHDVWS